ncbi:MAG: arylesterase [Sulfuricellaceae bacterium]|nr:arylesterase [Sulfuricellaceae bacterium]
MYLADDQIKSTGFRFLVYLMIAFFLLASCSKKKEAPLPSGSQVLALGDSLTAGNGVTSREAWPSLLASRTGWHVVNGGVSGDTSEEALQRLPALLEEHQPVLVLVTLGGNDMLRHIPQNETIANLEKILALIKAQGARPVLLAVPKPSVAGAAFRSLTAADFYQDVARSQHTPLIKDAVAEVLSDPQMKGDPLHPNAAGHALLSVMIYDAIKSIGYIR